MIRRRLDFGREQIAQRVPVNGIERLAGDTRRRGFKTLRRRDAAADCETRRRDTAGTVEEENTRRSDDARRESRAKADLAMRRPMSSGDRRHQDGDDDVVVPRRRAQPIAQRQRRHRPRNGDLDGRSERQQCRDEAAGTAGNIAAERRQAANAGRRDPAQGLGEQRQLLGDKATFLKLSESRGGADPDVSSTRGDAGELGKPRDIDQIRRPRLPAPPFELQRRCAGDNAPFAGNLGEDVGGFGKRPRTPHAQCRAR